MRSLGKEVNINPPLTLGQLPDTPEELLKLDQVFLFGSFARSSVRLVPKGNRRIRENVEKVYEKRSAYFERLAGGILGSGAPRQNIGEKKNYYYLKT